MTLGRPVSFGQMVPEVFVISRNRFFLAKRDTAKNQRLFNRRQADGILPAMEIEMERLRVVTGIIIGQIKLTPERSLHLPGSDIITPVIALYRAAVGPDPLNNQLAGLKEGKFPVDPQLPFYTGPPAFDRVIFNFNLVEPGGIHIYFPLDKPFFAGFYRPPGSAGKVP